MPVMTVECNGQDLISHNDRDRCQTATPLTSESIMRQPRMEQISIIQIMNEW